MSDTSFTMSKSQLVVFAGCVFTIACRSSTSQHVEITLHGEGTSTVHVRNVEMEIKHIVMGQKPCGA